MAHMQPDISQGDYFEVETTNGTEIVPGDVIGRFCGTAAEAFANYVEGKIADPEECIECKNGWLARMSAPGYMDCTDWTAHESEQAAQEYLRDTYGVFFGNEPLEDLIAQCNELGFDIVKDTETDYYRFVARAWVEDSCLFDTEREAAQACIEENAG